MNERAKGYELEKGATAVAPGASLQRAEEREDPEEEVALADVGGKGRALGEVEDEGAADASGGLDDLRGREEKEGYGVGLEHHGHVFDSNPAQNALHGEREGREGP